MANNYSLSALSRREMQKSFEVTKETKGKEIVDYFSSFGREGIELFIKEANSRPYFKKNHFSQKTSPRDLYTHRSRSVFTTRQEKPSNFVDYSAGQTKSLKTRVDHYMKLMEFEDEDTILNNDNT